VTSAGRRQQTRGTREKRAGEGRDRAVGFQSVHTFCLGFEDVGLLWACGLVGVGSARERGKGPGGVWRVLCGCLRPGRVARARGGGRGDRGCVEPMQVWMVCVGVVWVEAGTRFWVQNNTPTISSSSKIFLPKQHDQRVHA
jgi:hypothetical protein